MITDRTKTHYQNSPLRDVEFPLLPLESIQKHSLSCTRRTGNVLRTTILPKFGVPTFLGNVRCPYKLRTPLCCLATDELRPIRKKNKLNWKLKISNTADNADITHSQHYRHRRMLKVNRLCTDSGPLASSRILYCGHFTQSYLVLVLWTLMNMLYLRLTRTRRSTISCSSTVYLRTGQQKHLVIVMQRSEGS